jgi:hypothetical protein
MMHIALQSAIAKTRQVEGAMDKGALRTSRKVRAGKIEAEK